MLTAACSLLLFSTVVRLSVCLLDKDQTEIGFLGDTAPRDRYHKDHGRVYIVSRPRKLYYVFFGRIALDIRVQELRVCCTDANRGRRPCEFSLRLDERHPLTPIAALPLLCGMAIQTCHDFSCATLVHRCW